MDNLNKKIGELVRNSRIDNGFTQDFLADAIGVSKNTIQNIEYGYNLPSLKIGLKLEVMLDIKFVSLLENMQFESPFIEFSLITKELELASSYKNSKSFQYYFNQLLILVDNNPQYFPKHSIFYKQFCFYSARNYLLHGFMTDSFEELCKAESIQVSPSKVNDLLNNRILLLKLSINPCITNDNSKDTAISTINLLKEKLEKEIFPTRLKIAFIHNIMLIYFYKLNDYESALKQAHTGIELSNKSKLIFNHYKFRFYHALCIYKLTARIESTTFKECLNYFNSLNDCFLVKCYKEKLSNNHINVV